MRLFALFIGVLLSPCLSAQVQNPEQNQNEKTKTGFVRFLVDVDNGYFEIVVDDTSYYKIYKCELAPGHHKAKIWSPGYVTTQVEFDVEAGKTTDKYVEMAISNGRQQFERDYKEYNKKFHKSLTIPLSISLGMALTSGTFMLSAYSIKQKIHEDINLYFASPTYQEAVDFSNSIADRNQKYNRRRVIFYTTFGLTLASIGTTIYTFTKFKRNNKEPKLIAPSPFRDKFSMGITPYGCSFNWRFG